jgi:hypothetical protein
MKVRLLMKALKELLGDDLLGAIDLAVVSQVKAPQLRPKSCVRHALLRGYSLRRRFRPRLPEFTRAATWRLPQFFTTAALSSWSTNSSYGPAYRWVED